MSDMLNAINALASDYPSKTVYLSGIGQAVFYYTWDYLNQRSNWINRDNPYDEITEVQWDTIRGYIDQTNYEVDRNIMIGQIMVYVTEFPPINVLPCDGSILERINYPLLYQNIDPVFHIDGDSFYLPDLRDRTIIGAGGAYSVASAGGSVNETLITDQIPAHGHGNTPHSHADIGHVHSIGFTTTTLVLAPGEVPALIPVPLVPASTGIASANLTADGITINDTGGGEPHNNMPPYMALNWGIVAL